MTPVLGSSTLLHRFGDRRGQVAVAHAELDRDETTVVFTVDVRGPGLWATMCVNWERGIRYPGLELSEPGYVDQDPVDHFGIVAQLRRQPQGDVEELFALDHLGERLAADGGLHDSFDIVDIDAVAGAELAVDLDLEIRLADDVKQADVFDSGHRFQDVRDPLAELLERVQIRADDLDRVGALDAGEGFFDVVADVLREVEVDARVALELLHQLLFDVLAARSAHPRACSRRDRPAVSAIPPSVSRERPSPG